MYYGVYENNTTLEKSLVAATSALESGITLEQLLKRNPTYRGWYERYKAAEIKNAAQKGKEAERKRKEAARRAAKAAAKAEVMARLSPEELELFGLNKKRK